MVVNQFFNVNYISIRCHPSFLHAVASQSSLYICKGGIGFVPIFLCVTFRIHVHTASMCLAVTSFVDAMVQSCALIRSTASPPSIGVVVVLLFSASSAFDFSASTSTVPSVMSSFVGFSALDVALTLSTFAERLCNLRLSLFEAYAP